MAAEGYPLAAGSVLSAAVLIIIIIAIAMSRSRSGIVKLGLVSSLRRPLEIAYPAIPVALVGAVVLASLGTGDGLEAMVERNVERNMSGVGVIAEFPDAIELSDDTLIALQEYDIVPALVLHATGIAGSASAQVTVIGADEGITELLPVHGTSGGSAFPYGIRALVNRKAASAMDISDGSDLELRLPRSTARNLVGKGQSFTSISVIIDEVIDDSGLGRFRPDARGDVDPTVILDLDHLSGTLGEKGAVNRLLCPDGMSANDVRSVLEGTIVPSDLGFEIVPFENGSLIRNRDFIFDDPGLIGSPSVAYFVDSINHGNRSISYSTVLAIPDAIGSWPAPEEGSVIVSNHTAERLDIKVGDVIVSSYRLVGDDGGLTIGRSSLTVARVLPIDDLVPLRTLIPPIEGITESQSCSDWSPSFGVDLDNITGDDIDYWTRYNTTPKMLMNITDAKEAFGSIYGDTTGILVDTSPDDTRMLISDRTGIGYKGGRMIDSRRIAQESDRGMAIFPSMFLTFGSTIVMAASLTLWGTLRGRSARRAQDRGIARTLGLRRWELFLVSVLDAIPSVILGIALSIPAGYALSLLLGGPLGPGWSGTDQRVGLAIVPATVLFSSSLAFIISIFVVASISAKDASRNASSQLRSESEMPPTSKVWFVPAISGAGASFGIAILLFSGSVEANAISSVMFVLGSAIASGGTAVLGLWMLTSVKDRSAERLLVTANLRRRHSLTPIIVSVLALTVGIAVSLSAIGSGLEGGLERSAADYGGGYDYYAEMATPYKEGIDRSSKVLQDKGYSTTSLLSVGDEGGSCTNINAPFPPRLIGIEDDLRLRVLKWSMRYGSSDDVWTSLNTTFDGRVPIIVDENTLIWIYSGDVGSIYEITDEEGRGVEIEVVGILAPSVLSGSFVMAKRFLKDLYPRAAKESIVLVRSPGTGGIEEDVQKALSGMAPDIRTIRSMAKENLDYELGYLYLFRGFLMTGIVTGVASALSFTAARTAERSMDHSTLRSVGATRRTLRRALIAENAAVFVSASAGALVIGLFAGFLGAPVGDPDILSLLLVSLLIPALVISAGTAFSAVGAYIATREGSMRRRE